MIKAVMAPKPTVVIRVAAAHQCWPREPPAARPHAITHHIACEARALSGKVEYQPYLSRTVTSVRRPSNSVRAAAKGPPIVGPPSASTLLTGEITAATSSVIAAIIAVITIAKAAREYTAPSGRTITPRPGGVGPDDPDVAVPLR